MIKNIMKAFKKTIKQIHQRTQIYVYPVDIVINKLVKSTFIIIIYKAIRHSYIGPNGPLITDCHCLLIHNKTALTFCFNHAALISMTTFHLSKPGGTY